MLRTEREEGRAVRYEAAALIEGERGHRGVDRPSVKTSIHTRWLRLAGPCAQPRELTIPITFFGPRRGFIVSKMKIEGLDVRVRVTTLRPSGSVQVQNRMLYDSGDCITPAILEGSNTSGMKA